MVFVAALCGLAAMAAESRIPVLLQQGQAEDADVVEFSGAASVDRSRVTLPLLLSVGRTLHQDGALTACMQARPFQVTLSVAHTDCCSLSFVQLYLMCPGAVGEPVQGYVLVCPLGPAPCT